jgi:hypothetical protein
MWDPTEFYDDLEHSCFLNNAYMWDRCWFMKFFQSLWCHKTAWNGESPAIVPTVMTKVFLSQNLLRSEILL